jgi:methionyl-tRNA formyltransferase
LRCKALTIHRTAALTLLAIGHWSSICYRVFMLRVIFMGTAELACASLRALCQDGFFEVAAAVTQPDRPKGRDLRLTPSPVKQVALAQGVPVLQPERARQEGFLKELQDYRPELIVVAAYGQILPAAILELPRLGCVNVHTSLLPKYRGAAPIQWAILEDQAETGVTIMKMDAGLDTGPILAQESTPILPADNAQTLHDRLAEMGAALLVKTVRACAAGELQPRPQPGAGASYARKLTKEDGRLDWSQPARALWSRIRAFTPWPGAYARFTDRAQPRVLKIWSAEVVPERRGAPGEVLEAGRAGIVAACGADALRITLLQLEGGRRLEPEAFLAGHALKQGQFLG